MIRLLGRLARGFCKNMEEDKTIKTLTAKEMKNLAKPEFAKNPELFYPTQVFSSFGFHRAQCSKCGANYWRHTEARDTCGDSKCVGSYQFIGVGTGRGAKGNKLTYAQAWETFKKSLSSARIPSKAIDRYPVVARWRNDVEYVAAGIYCFQPYCVTGELEPPANPLICPQFCVRFNDLDNIGITGRHYSGFIMLGIQVFNLPNKYLFFKEECVEFNLRWLIDELEIHPDQITLIEDVWAGGGNLGPSVEYFVGGLEVGNMVFMQYKTFPDGSREELPVKVIDVGIGLERIPWLINGTPTSYMDVFKNSFTYLKSKLGIEVNNEVWEKFGPLSCQLNIDEVDDIEQTWRHISEMIGIPVQTVKEAISPVKDMYIVLDHTRTVLMIIEDGSLPSNVGGGANVRNILRRVFALLKKRGWWDLLGMDGLIELFMIHKEDLKEMYGEFKEYKSFRSIIEVEYDRWIKTDTEQKDKLQKLLKKNKNKLSIDDWIVAITSWGIPADVVAQISGMEIPGNLYYEIAERQEKITKAPEPILYNTAHLPATESIYYHDHTLSHFHASIVDIFPNITMNGIPNIVILDKSAFYPTSGGQQHDTGKLSFKGVEYTVIDVEKVGHCVLHILDRAVEGYGTDDGLRGAPVEASIDMARRNQLRNHHTGTHIVFASCRKVLGPHVWQNGAKKTVEQAHLDITHYKSLSHEEEQQIENEANRIISLCRPIEKGFMDKAEAEKQYGFSLYQGGIVPGSTLRVVNITGVDTEACCGTHCDNTAEVGWIRILKSQRVSDGIVRLYYVAGERAIERLNQEDAVLNNLSEMWKIPLNDIPTTAERMFKGYKKYETKAKKLEEQLIDMTVRCIASDSSLSRVFVKSDREDPTIYFSFLKKSADVLKQAGKSVIFISPKFLYGLMNVDHQTDLDALVNTVGGENPVKNIRDKISYKVKGKNVTVDGVKEFSCIGKVDLNQVLHLLQQSGFSEFSTN